MATAKDINTTTYDIPALRYMSLYLHIYFMKIQKNKSLGVALTEPQINTSCEQRGIAAEVEDMLQIRPTVTLS